MYERGRLFAANPLTALRVRECEGEKMCECVCERERVRESVGE